MSSHIGAPCLLVFHKEAYCLLCFFCFYQFHGRNNEFYSYHLCDYDLQLALHFDISYEYSAVTQVNSNLEAIRVRSQNLGIFVNPSR